MNELDPGFNLARAYEISLTGRSPGELLTRLRRHDEAIRHYVHALDIDPAYRAAWSAAPGPPRRSRSPHHESRRR